MKIIAIILWVIIAFLVFSAIQTDIWPFVCIFVFLTAYYIAREKKNKKYEKIFFVLALIPYPVYVLIKILFDN